MHLSCCPVGAVWAWLEARTFKYIPVNASFLLSCWCSMNSLRNPWLKSTRLSMNLFILLQYHLACILYHCSVAITSDLLMQEEHPWVETSLLLLACTLYHCSVAITSDLLMQEEHPWVETSLLLLACTLYHCSVAITSADLLMQEEHPWVETSILLLLLLIILYYCFNAVWIEGPPAWPQTRVTTTMKVCACVRMDGCF